MSEQEKKWREEFEPVWVCFSYVDMRQCAEYFWLAAKRRDAERIAELAVEAAEWKSRSERRVADIREQSVRHADEIAELRARLDVIAAECKEGKLDLEVANVDWSVLASDFRAMRERALAAEAKLDALEKQEPVAEVIAHDTAANVWWKTVPNSLAIGTKLYAKPVPATPANENQECYACKEREHFGQPATGIYSNDFKNLIDMRDKHIGKLEQQIAELKSRPAPATPAIPALLFEAFDYGQFADDFDRPLAKPLRKAIRDMLTAAQKHSS